MKSIEEAFSKIEREAKIFKDYVVLDFRIEYGLGTTTLIDYIAHKISEEIQLSYEITKEVFRKAFENVFRKYENENREINYLIFDIDYTNYNDKLEILERIKEITADVATSLEIAMYELKELKKKYDMTNYIIEKMQFDPCKAKFVKIENVKEDDDVVIL